MFGTPTDAGPPPKDQEERNDLVASISANHTLKHQLLSRAGKEFHATHDKPDAETRKYAVMSDATYIAETKGLDAAQSFLDEKLGTERYTIHPRHSDELSLVIIDSKDGKGIMAYRGSTNASDWALNGLNWLSNELKEIHPEFRRVDKHWEAVKDDGIEIKHITGHSKAGLHGVRQAVKRNVPADVFNPEIFGTNHGYLDQINEKGLDVKIHRITHDVASYGLASYNVKKYLQKHGAAGEFAGDLLKSGGDLRRPLINAARNVVTKKKYVPHKIDIRTYPPLNGYENPMHAHSLVNFYLEGDRRIETKTRRQRLAHGSTQVGGQIGINLAANELTNRFVDTIIGDDLIDPTLQNALVGGVSNTLTEKAAQGLGLHTLVGGRKISMRNAFASGAVSSVVGSAVQDEAYKALRSTGLGHNESTILASGAGGGATAASEEAANVAIAYAGRKFGSAAITSAVRAQIARGVARVGVGRAIMILGANTLRWGSRGRLGGGRGTLLGIGFGIMLGVLQILHENKERTTNALPPGDNEEADFAIGNDEVIRGIIKHLNDQQDGHNDDQDRAQAKEKVLARLQTMRIQGNIPRGYYADFDFVTDVPESLIRYDGTKLRVHGMSKGVMLAGAYKSETAAIEARDDDFVHNFRSRLASQYAARKQQEADFEAGKAEFARNQLNLLIAHGWHFDQSRQDEMHYVADLYRRYAEGKLPAEESAVLEELDPRVKAHPRLPFYARGGAVPEDVRMKAILALMDTDYWSPDLETELERLVDEGGSAVEQVLRDYNNDIDRQNADVQADTTIQRMAYQQYETRGPPVVSEEVQAQVHHFEQEKVEHQIAHQSFAGINA